MIELVILGMLRQSPLHGYELRRRIRQQFGMFTRVSFGSLYPALNRLLKEGAVQEKTGVASPSLPTGSLSAEKALWKTYGSKVPSISSSKSKKIYEITPKGEQLLQELLYEPWESEDAKGFLVRLAFSKYLTPSERMKLLKKRALFLEKTIEDLQHELKTIPSDDSYLKAIKTRFLLLSLTEQKWLTDLISYETADNKDKVEVTL
jgi:DNA-binding PadR family transcriptional regulator